MATPMAEEPNFEDDQLASMTTEDILRASRLLDNENRIRKIRKTMDEVGVEEEIGYKPDGAFEVDTRDPLVDLHLDDSKELWLLQWTPNQIPDFSGKELSLNLQNDGCVGSFEGSSGKTYDLVNCASGGQDATVFLSSPSGTRIVGKISRRFSLVRYIDPKELEQQEAERKSKRNQLAACSSFVNSSLYSTPTQSTKLRNSQSFRGHTVTTNSSRQKSSLSELGEKSHHKKRRAYETAASTDRSTLVSEQGHSTQTMSR